MGQATDGESGASEQRPRPWAAEHRVRGRGAPIGIANVAQRRCYVAAMRRVTLALLIFVADVFVPEMSVSDAFRADASAQEPPANASVLGTISELVAHHRNREALEALERLPTAVQARPDVAYLAGRLHELVGQLGQAAQRYGQVEGLAPQLMSDAQWRAGRALARTGHCADALTRLDSAEGSAAPQAAAIAAECRARLAVTPEERAAAIDALRAVVRADAQNVDVVAAGVLLAELLVEGSKTDDAQAVLRPLHIERPTHPDAGLVAERLFDLNAPALTPEETLARARAFYDERQPARAAELLERRPPRSLRPQWLHLRGMALYKTRHNYAEASRVLAQAARAGGATAVDDAFHAARALSRADRDAQAIRAYRRLVRRSPRHARAGQAEYLAAWLELHIGRRSGASAMQRFADGPRATSRRRRDALWHLALRAFEGGRFSTAAQLFTRYAELGSGPMQEGRGRYWAARSRHRMGRHALAIRLYREARASAPLHWYGVWAGMRLRELGVDEPPPLGEPDEDHQPAQLDLGEVASTYARLGLIDDARRAFRRRERELRRDGATTRQLTDAYLRLGAAHRAYQLADPQRRLLRQKPDGAAQWAWNAAYPRPYRALVREAARRSQVEVAHVYATMRQESGYQPTVVSHADAIGLLQVMPEVGRRRGQAVGARVDRDRLFDPRWNTRLGADEISSVMHQFDGSLPLAIAAYNAGAARVRRWIEAWPHTDMDLFVEKIPFNETRNYVRRVTSHYARYRYLSEPDARIALPLRTPGSE